MNILFLYIEHDIPRQLPHSYIPGAGASYRWFAEFEIDPPLGKDGVIHHLGELAAQYATAYRPVY